MAPTPAQAPIPLSDLASPSAHRRLIASFKSASAAAIRLSPAAAQTLQSLHDLGEAFFALPSTEKEACQHVAKIDSAGPVPVLVGYRRPSPAKELLRVYGRCLPPKRLPRPLRVALARARALLDGVLRSCLLALGRRDVSCRAMRRRLRAGCAPLDLFSYCNSTPTPNCTEHVDRGLLHAIVASPVPGLELRAPPDGVGAPRWTTPLELWPGLTAHRDVIILVNHELQQLSAEPAGVDDEISSPWAGEPLVACTHRVTKAAGRRRLSISYELRRWRE